MADELIGQVLGGSYRLLRPLGEGGMGVVYEAEHLRLPRRLAVKILHAEIGREKEVVERFRREAFIASALGHQNIVEVIDFNVTDTGIPFMVLELLEGQDLAARIARFGRLTLAQALPILEQLTRALEAAHAHGIVHRDLKPQNIYLCPRGGRDDFVKILDFGISKMLHSGSIVTRTGSIFGTPNYMSPEQAEGRGIE
ncbi:MAG: serine/threonine-protein kinase, partial [Myxococcota bacterium]